MSGSQWSVVLQFACSCVVSGCSRLRELEAESATRSDSTVSDLQEKISECARLKMELESSRATQAYVEDKILQAETDNSQLRSNLRQYETLVEEYRGQVLMTC